MSEDIKEFRKFDWLLTMSSTLESNLDQFFLIVNGFIVMCKYSFQILLSSEEKRVCD